MKSHSLRFASIALASLAASSLASCQETPTPATGGEAGNAAMQVSFAKQDMGTFDEPWAIAFEPGTGTLFVTEKSGAIRFRKADGTTGDVSGVPDVDYGGQGGLGDIVFAPDYASSHAVYISYAEAGSGDTRGAAVMRATLQCDQADDCALRDPRVIWRQDEKVTGRGHYSHRIAFSPDGARMYFSDSRVDRSYQYDLDKATGRLSNRRVFLDTTAYEGRVDGATVDAEGCYWAALFSGAAIARFDPDGTLMQKIELPVSCPTMCSFGGPDLDILYVTSATFVLEEDELARQPLAGALFAIEGLGAQGLEEPRFAIPG